MAAGDVRSYADTHGCSVIGKCTRTLVDRAASDVHLASPICLVGENQRLVRVLLLRCVGGEMHQNVHDTAGLGLKQTMWVCMRRCVCGGGGGNICVYAYVGLGCRSRDTQPKAQRPALIIMQTLGQDLSIKGCCKLRCFGH